MRKEHNVWAKSAFPISVEDDERNREGGMTYREWLIGMSIDQHLDAEDAAEHAINIADEILARLAKEWSDGGESE
jgi:hypothetical protein